jgi:hypothetical protein
LTLVIFFYNSETVDVNQTNILKNQIKTLQENNVRLTNEFNNINQELENYHIKAYEELKFSAEGQINNLHGLIEQYKRKLLELEQQNQLYKNQINFKSEDCKNNQGNRFNKLKEKIRILKKILNIKEFDIQAKENKINLLQNRLNGVN